MLSRARATVSRCTAAAGRWGSTGLRAAAASEGGAGSSAGSIWPAAALLGVAGATAAMTACDAEPNPEYATMTIFSGNANPDLAAEIATHVGKPLGSVTVGRFPDGEVSVSVHENVRGKDVYIIQPTCPPHVNDYLVELLLLVTTMRRASAEKITVVVPYYGYARQDRKMTSRVPISAADIARLLESVGVDFFAKDGGLVNPVIVSPDAGGVYRAKKFREGLNSAAGTDAGLAMIIKQRPRAGVIGQMDLVGEVAGCDCIIVDDMIDTAGTLCKAADLLKVKGANRVFCFASHGLFSGPAVSRISKSCLEKVVVVNTIPLPPNAKTCNKIEQLSVAAILGEAIKRIHLRRSVSEMFQGQHKIVAASTTEEARA